MQEEVTQRTVALCVEATRLSAGMLQQAMKKVLDEMQKGVTGHKTKLHHGKQTLRQLMKHNTGVSNIEITDQNIRAFSATAKKYGIDFALKKDTSGEIPRYLVFFKGRDADVTIHCLTLHGGIVSYYTYWNKAWLDFTLTQNESAVIGHLSGGGAPFFISCRSMRPKHFFNYAPSL